IGAKAARSSAISPSPPSTRRGSKRPRPKARAAACKSRPRARSQPPARGRSRSTPARGRRPATRGSPVRGGKPGKPAILIANKGEGSAGEAGVLEAYELGLGEPIAISAEHGEGLTDLYAGLRAALPDATALAAEVEPRGSDIEQKTPERKPIR